MRHMQSLFAATAALLAGAAAMVCSPDAAAQVSYNSLWINGSQVCTSLTSMTISGTTVQVSGTCTSGTTTTTPPPPTPKSCSLAPTTASVTVGSAGPTITATCNADSSSAAATGYVWSVTINGTAVTATSVAGFDPTTVTGASLAIPAAATTAAAAGGNIVVSVAASYPGDAAGTTSSTLVSTASVSVNAPGAACTTTAAGNLAAAGTTVYPSVPAGAGKYVAYGLPQFTAGQAQLAYVKLSLAPDGVTGYKVNPKLTISKCPGDFSGTDPAGAKCSVTQYLGPNGWNMNVAAGSGTSMCFIPTGGQYYVNVWFTDATCATNTCSLILNLNSVTTATPLN